MAIVKLFALNANARKHNKTVTREKQWQKDIKIGIYNFPRSLLPANSETLQRTKKLDTRVARPGNETFVFQNICDILRAQSLELSSKFKNFYNLNLNQIVAYRNIKSLINFFQLHFLFSTRISWEVFYFFYDSWNSLLKGYLRYKTILCHKVALDV